MPQKIRLRKPSDKDAHVKVTSSQNETTVTFNVGLHTKDVDKLLMFAYYFMKNKCRETEEFIDKFHKEQEEFLEIFE